MSVLLSDQAILVYEGIVGVGLILNCIRFYRRNKKLKEMVSLQKDRIREEELDAMLQNQMYIERNADVAVKNNPYEINYHEEADAAYENEKAHVSVQFEELGNLSNKKYVVHIFDKIKVGRDESNKIILNDITIAEHQLEFLRVDTDLFVKNLETYIKVTLKRKRKKFALTETPVCLKSGDELELGNTRLRISLI